MANSTAVITDATTADNGAWTTATNQKAATKGLDVDGNMHSVVQGLQDARNLLRLVAAACAADPQLTLINNILGTLS
jgi:hypothetical protein